jgi:hypothetical protein
LFIVFADFYGIYDEVSFEQKFNFNENMKWYNKL